jgi:hypothetical protein
MPALRTGDLVRDRDLMEEAHRDARALVEGDGVPATLEGFVRDRWPQQFGLIDVG